MFPVSHPQPKCPDPQQSIRALCLGSPRLPMARRLRRSSVAEIKGRDIVCQPDLLSKSCGILLAESFGIMNITISDDHIASYRENGFVAIENFLDDSELEVWRSVTDDAVAQRLRDRSGFTNQSNPDDYYAKVFTQCVRLADTHGGMAKLITDARLGKVAAIL